MSDADTAATLRAPARPDPPRSLQATAVVATLGVVAALLGLALLLRPVTTPVQDCGTALAFMLDGRVNEFADPADPPAGLTAAEVDEANARPCRSRVADAARPALALGATGVVVATAAAIVEVGLRTRGWLRRRRESAEVRV